MTTSAPLRIVHGPDTVDVDAAERAAAAFLTALGIPLASESLRATPGRMARAYAEMFTARRFELTTFPNDAGYDELVIARSIPVHMTLRGVRSDGTRTVTSAVGGELRDDARSRAEFLSLAGSCSHGDERADLR